MYFLNLNLNKNRKLENTEHISFEERKLSNYLNDNKKIALLEIIFSIRSKTLDIKKLQPWKYFDNLCVLCEEKAETIPHFMSCNSYQNEPLAFNFELIYQNNPDKQFEIAKHVRKRLKIGSLIIENYEAGYSQDLSDPMASGHC